MTLRPCGPPAGANILVDFDSTLADTLSVVAALLTFKYGALLLPHDFTDWNWKENAKRWNRCGLHPKGRARFRPAEVEDDFWAIFDLLDETHLRRAIRPVHPLACASVKWLISRGHHVVVGTSNTERAVNDIHSWLFGHGLGEVAVVAFGRNDPALRVDRPYDLFIDDSPAVARECEARGKHVFLVPQPYNRLVLRSKHVFPFDWENAIELFRARGL